MPSLKKSKGFTLLEILIVLVILAVLAGLAVPAYTTSVEKSRRQEALQSLGAVRGAQQRYMAGYNRYAATFNQLDFDPTVIGTGNNPHFTYAMATAGNGLTYTATATRNNVDNNPASPAVYTITMTHDGAFS